MNGRPACRYCGAVLYADDRYKHSYGYYWHKDKGHCVSYLKGMVNEAVREIGKLQAELSNVRCGLLDTRNQLEDHVDSTGVA